MHVPVVWPPVQFQHTAARRRLHQTPEYHDQYGNGFNTQPPEGGCTSNFSPAAPSFSFNTQPPEGGCRHHYLQSLATCRFNTQPPEGGCIDNLHLLPHC